jgi:hypothetical protein
MQNFDHNIGFWEKRQFFAENCRKSQKIVIITSTPAWKHGCMTRVCEFSPLWRLFTLNKKLVKILFCLPGVNVKITIYVISNTFRLKNGDFREKQYNEYLVHRLLLAESKLQIFCQFFVKNIENTYCQSYYFWNNIYMQLQRCSRLGCFNMPCY